MNQCEMTHLVVSATLGAKLAAGPATSIEGAEQFTCVINLFMVGKIVSKFVSLMNYIVFRGGTGGFLSSNAY